MRGVPLCRRLIHQTLLPPLIGITKHAHLPKHTPLQIKIKKNSRADPATGVLDTTLRILPTRVTDGPVAFSSRAYEGTIPGPTLVLRPGETLKLMQVGGCLCKCVGVF